MSDRTRTVLIVDDEALFRRSLADGLRAAGERHHFVVRTAYNGLEAIAVIENEPVDLVLTDLRMPTFDGLQLIAWMISTRRAIPTVVMTALPSPDATLMLRACGVFSMLQKPVDLQEVQRCIISELGARRARLEGIAVIAYLQLLAMERSTSVVTIRSNGRVGWLKIDAGDLVDAEFEELEGASAAYALVGLSDVTIEMVERASIEGARIRVGLSAVIFEALRLRDERERGAAPLSSTPPPALGDEVDIEFNVLRTAPPPPSATAGLPEFSLVRSIDDSAPTMVSLARAEPLPAPPQNRAERVRVALDALVVHRVRGLRGAEVWSASSGMPLASWGVGAVPASFDRITESIRSALTSASYPALARYYVLDLADALLAVVVPGEALHASLLIDNSEAQLGMVLSVVLPEFVRALEAAVADGVSALP